MASPNRTPLLSGLPANRCGRLQNRRIREILDPMRGDHIAVCALGMRRPQPAPAADRFENSIDNNKPGMFDNWYKKYQI